MYALNYRYPRSGHLALFFLALAFFAKATPAQQYKDVEIEVVGPWSIASDPRPGGGPPRVVLIAPITAKTAHEVDVYPGANPYIYSKDIKAGSYALDLKFDPANCDGNQHSTLLSFATVQTTPSVILSAINNPQNRYAISLPRPCYFETYLDARAIVSGSTINDSKGDQRYTTWLKFHYRVETSVKSATFSGKVDTTGAISPYPVTFSPSPHPPKGEALTMVLYDDTDPEDYECDIHSAAFFDASVVNLWKQTAFRLFPQLDNGHNQSGTYDLTCNQIPGRTAMMVHEPTRAHFRERISSIREALRSSDPKAIQQGADRLEEEIKETAGKQLPKAIDDDLITVRRIVGFLQEDKANKFQAINADVYLRLTEYIFTAGRTDCHSMQVNVNNAVN
jgi:hypothetical protein